MELLIENILIYSLAAILCLVVVIIYLRKKSKESNIVIQLGAILAVAVYFWKRLSPVGKDRADKKRTYDIWKKTIVGVLPAIVIGALLGKTIEEKLFNPFVVAGALIIGGIIILYIERKRIKHRFDTVADISLKTAFYIGLIQCLAMIPGTSRAGATIIGAMMLGVARPAAAEFSFFLAIPTMIAASGYSLLKHGSMMTGAEAILLATGFITAFLTALAAVGFLMRYIERHDFKIFGYYRIALGVIVMMFFLMM